MNRRPLACHASALPAELYPRKAKKLYLITYFLSINEFHVKMNAIYIFIFARKIVVLKIILRFIIHINIAFNPSAYMRD